MGMRPRMVSGFASITQPHREVHAALRGFAGNAAKIGPGPGEREDLDGSPGRNTSSAPSSRRFTKLFGLSRYSAPSSTSSVIQTAAETSGFSEYPLPSPPKPKSPN